MSEWLRRQIQDLLAQAARVQIPFPVSVPVGRHVGRIIRLHNYYIIIGLLAIGSLAQMVERGAYDNCHTFRNAAVTSSSLVWTIFFMFFFIF